MKKSALALAVAGVMGTGAANAIPVVSGTFTMYDPTGAVVGGSAIVTGNVATTGLVPGINLTSPTPFFGFKWTAHDSTFVNNGNNTVSGAHPFDWGATPNIPVVVLWDISNPANWVALDGDNNGIPGTAMTAGPFAGFEPFFNVSTIPIPAAAWLFGSGLLGLVGVARRRRKS